MPGGLIGAGRTTRQDAPDASPADGPPPEAATKPRLRALVASALVLSAAAASADIVYLTNGGQIRGRVISRGDGAVVVEVPRGVVRLRGEEVLRIEPEGEAERLLAEAVELSRGSRAAEGLALLERAAEAGASEAQLRAAKLKVLRAEAARLEGLLRLAEAHAVFARARELAPEDAELAASLERVSKKLAELRATVESARDSARRGEHAEAVALFEKALRIAPESRTVVGGEFADSCEALGDRALEQRDSSAASWYRRALELDPARAEALRERYVYARLLPVLEQLRRGELDAARKALDEIVELAPADAQARYVYGKLLEAKGDRAGAARQYRAAGAAPSRAGESGDGDLQALRAAAEARLREVRDEALSKKRLREERAKVEPGPARRLEGRHFVVHHRNGPLAQEVLQTAEHQVERILAALGEAGRVLWKEPCPIYLLPDEESFLAATGQPAWSGGLSHTESVGGRLERQYLTVYQTSPRLLTGTVPHEVAHLVFSALTKYAPGVPLALHEGFAVLQEPEFGARHERGLLIWKRLAGELIPLATLLEMRDPGDDPALFYAESASLVSFLVELKGLAAFLAFARDLAGRDAAAALRERFGIEGVEALERAYLASLDE